MPLIDHDKAFDEWWSKNRLPVEKGTLRRGWRLGAETERARIREELLALHEASPASPPHLYRADIERICGPEEG